MANLQLQLRLLEPFFQNNGASTKLKKHAYPHWALLSTAMSISVGMALWSNDVLTGAFLNASGVPKHLKAWENE